MNLSRLTFFVMAVLAIGVGVVCILGGDDWRIGPKEQGIALEPAELFLVDTWREGDRRSATMRFENCSGQDAVITDGSASCGCVRFLTQTGHDPQWPIVVPAGAAWQFEVVMDAENKMGPQTFVVALKGEWRERPFFRKAEIHATVLSAWRADPSQLFVETRDEETSASKQVIIYDGYPGDGIAIDRIATSSADVIDVTCTKLAASSKVYHAQMLSGLKPRYALDIKLVDTRSMTASEWVTLIPKGRGIPKLHIPIALRHESPALCVKPSSVAIVLPNACEVMRRKLFVSAEEPFDEGPTVRCSHGEVVAEVKTVDQKNVTIDVMLPSALARRAEQVVVTVKARIGGTQFEKDVPIQFMR